MALFAATIGDLEAARSLAFDDDLAVPRAQFDLADVSASDIDLLSDQGVALQAAVSRIRAGVRVGAEFVRRRESGARSRPR